MEPNTKVNSVFRDEFLPYIIKWGRGLNLLGVVLCFGPCLYLALMGIMPRAGDTDRGTCRPVSYRNFRLYL